MELATPADWLYCDVAIRKLGTRTTSTAFTNSHADATLYRVAGVGQACSWFRGGGDCASAARGPGLCQLNEATPKLNCVCRVAAF